MSKPKIIKKKDLMQVRLAYIKYYNIKDNEIVENYAYEEWKKTCEKAFPINKNQAPHKYNLLKDLSRDLRREPFETWIKVYEALGYVVTDNPTDYLRKRYEELKESVYHELCNGCFREKECHDKCEHCETYYKALEKKGIKED